MRGRRIGYYGRACRPSGSFHRNTLESPGSLQFLERVLPKCVLEASWDVLIRQPLDCADAGGGTCNHFPFLR